MSVESILLAALRASPDLDAAVIRPSKVEQTDLPPYVIYQKTSGVRIADLSGETGLSNPQFQIDCYAATLGQATALRDAVRKVLLAEPALRAVHVNESSSYEESVKLFRELQEFSFWFQC